MSEAKEGRKTFPHTLATDLSIALFCVFLSSRATQSEDKTSECKKAPNQAFCLLMMRPTFGNLTVDLLMKDKPVGSMAGMNWDEISIATISISFL